MLLKPEYKYAWVNETKTEYRVVGMRAAQETYGHWPKPLKGKWSDILDAMDEYDSGLNEDLTWPIAEITAAGSSPESQSSKHPGSRFSTPTPAPADESAYGPAEPAHFEALASSDVDHRSDFTIAEEPVEQTTLSDETAQGKQASLAVSVLLANDVDPTEPVADAQVRSAIEKKTSGEMTIAFKNDQTIALAPAEYMATQHDAIPNNDKSDSDLDGKRNEAQQSLFPFARQRKGKKQKKNKNKKKAAKKGQKQQKASKAVTSTVADSQADPLPKSAGPDPAPSHELSGPEEESKDKSESEELTSVAFRLSRTSLNAIAETPLEPGVVFNRFFNSWRLPELLARGVTVPTVPAHRDDDGKIIYGYNWSHPRLAVIDRLERDVVMWDHSVTLGEPGEVSCFKRARDNRKDDGSPDGDKRKAGTSSSEKYNRCAHDGGSDRGDGSDCASRNERDLVKDRFGMSEEGLENWLEVWTHEFMPLAKRYSKKKWEDLDWRSEPLVKPKTPTQISTAPKGVVMIEKGVVDSDDLVKEQNKILTECFRSGNWKEVCGEGGSRAMLVTLPDGDKLEIPQCRLSTVDKVVGLEVNPKAKKLQVMTEKTLELPEVMLGYILPAPEPPSQPTTGSDKSERSAAPKPRQPTKSSINTKSLKNKPLTETDSQKKELEGPASPAQKKDSEDDLIKPKPSTPEWLVIPESDSSLEMPELVPASP